jgi:hypothetical protein
MQEQQLPKFTVMRRSPYNMILSPHSIICFEAAVLPAQRS